MTATSPDNLGLSLPLWAVLPFCGFLFSLAVVPLFAPSFWSRHFGKVSLAFGLPVAVGFLLIAPGELLKTTEEYVSFLILLGSLFTISGGILIRGAPRATPWTNAALFFVGSVLSNLLGTTGASMLLLRPLLRANAHRKRSAHVVVFFIFTVANLGGALTPTGNPPLFLGYLQGVPFFWTASRMMPLWLFALTTTIGVFVAVDRWFLDRDGIGVTSSGEITPLGIEGLINLPLLAVVTGAVLFPTPWREMAMITASAISVWRTPQAIRDANDFTWHPIREVAILFAGIFVTMIPALLILKARGGSLGVTEPWQYFWGSGLLSGFLDSAPAYLVFFRLAQGAGAGGIAGVSAPVLKAISAGSVFMGAISYIGNAPNFMVKAIAESSGLRMPSFFGYMAWSCAVLIPTFLLVTLVFF